MNLGVCFIFTVTSVRAPCRVRTRVCMRVCIGANEKAKELASASERVFSKVCMFIVNVSV